MFMDAYSLRTVAEDLEHLRKDWGSDIRDPDIRRGSGVLRRLLVEGDYGLAWRALGFVRQPSLIAVDLRNCFFRIDRSDIIYALAWGTHFRGIRMDSPVYFKHLKGKQVRPPVSLPLRSNGYPGEREFTVSEFLSSVAGIAEGEAVTRQDVIKYVANIKGGVHLGKGQKQSEKELISRMAKFEQKISVHETDAILVELVAIAQAVGQSKDAEKLISAIHQQTIHLS